MIRVAVVDDNESTRWLFERITRESGDFICVGSYGRGEEVLRKALETKPQLILMDIRLRGISGIECMRRLKQLLPRLTVVFVSAATDADTMAEAFAAGGAAFLAKPFSVAQCLASLRFSIRDWRCSVELIGKVPLKGREKAPDIRALTARESDVMSGLAKGLLYKEIADKLGISFSAVHKHQHKIFTKLRASNRTEAISRWYESTSRLPFG